jgi:hypothetical protein
MTKRPSLADSMNKLKPAVPLTVVPAPVQTAEPTAPKGYYAATRAGQKKVTAGLEPEAHKQMKLLSIETGKGIEELLREGISDLFRKYGKAPIA